MMLKLSLPEDRFVWALVHPVSNEYIHSNEGVGYQECKLIISQADAQPVEVNLDEYPEWAQVMILTSIKSKELVNTGDSIQEIKKAKEDVSIKEVKKSKTTKKKQARRSRKKKMSKDV